MPRRNQFAVVENVSQQKGDQRGRTIGYPTANIALGDYLRPRAGVYAVTAVRADQSRHFGVANIGKRPTVGGAEERLEAHLFDFNGDLYGERLIIALNAFIRDEQKFESFEALKTQIDKDAKAALAIADQNRKR